MAIRHQLLRRFLSSLFSSQSGVSTASSSASSTDTNINDNPAINTSTTLFVFAGVVTDRATGYSKGFGFVRYFSSDDAEKGIKGMNEQYLKGWVIFAEYARPRAPPGQPVSDEAYPTNR